MLTFQAGEYEGGCFLFVEFGQRVLLGFVCFRWHREVDSFRGYVQAPFFLNFYYRLETGQAQAKTVKRI